MTVVIQASKPGRNPMSPPYSVRSKLKLGISTKATYTRVRYDEALWTQLLTDMPALLLVCVSECSVPPLRCYRGGGGFRF